jgi:hypothetical protein
MNDHQSLTQKLKNFFLPSKLTPLIWLIVSVIVLSLLNFQILWDILLGSSVGSVSPQDFSPVTDKFLEFQDRLSRPVLMALWGFIGALTYGFVWLSKSVFQLVRREVDESHYLREGGLPLRTYWSNALVGNLILGLAIVGWLIYLWLYFRFLLPSSSTLFSEGVYYHDYLQLVVAVLLNTLGIYGIILLDKTTVYFWRTSRPSI